LPLDSSVNLQGGQDRTYSSPLQPPVHQASEHLDDSIHCTDRRRATQAGVPVRVRPAGPMTLDNGSTWLYHSCMNNAIASAMVQAAHRVESRLEEALAGVGLSIAKFETLSVLVSQDRPISLSELAAKLVCVKSNVTQLVDRLETEGLVKRANDPADRRAVRAEVTALGRKRQAAGTPVVNAVLQDVANKLAAVDSQKAETRSGRHPVRFFWLSWFMYALFITELLSLEEVEPCRD
jgi:DNA-binding MarR family transcriptional regulator